MKQKKTIHVILITCIVLLAFFVSDVKGWINTIEVQAAETTQFSTYSNPGFEIWEDPNKPGYYAYDYSGLTNSPTRYWFDQNDYNSGNAFVRLGVNKPTTTPNGTKINRKNLRLVEVRPYGHNAFLSYQVQLEENDVKVGIRIAGVKLTETPDVRVQNAHNKGTWSSGDIYAEFHKIPLELIWEYTNEPTSFEPSPACPVNPENMVNSNDLNTSSLVKVICDEDSCTYYYDYLNVYIEDIKPSSLRAGYGFSIKVKTSYHNEYFSDWPGARRVVAYFQTAEKGLPQEIELEPLYSTNSWDNEWVFPDSFVEKYSGKIFLNPNDTGRDTLDTLIDGEKKWYTPFQHKDGAYNFKIVAYDAGYNSLKDAEGSYVAVCGTPFDDYVRRSVIPDKPFLDSGIGYNWKGKEMLLGNLITPYYNPNNNTGAESTYYLSNKTIKKIKDDQIRTITKSETSYFLNSSNFD